MVRLAPGDDSRNADSAPYPSGWGALLHAGRVPAYKHPRPPADGVPVTRPVEPIPVTFVWRISGSFGETVTGVAVAWSGDVVHVRSDEGYDGWVWARDVTRL